MNIDDLKNPELQEKLKSVELMGLSRPDKS